jgi:large subunit ribosomal protein L19
MNPQELLHSAVKSNLKNLPEIRPGYTVRIHQKIKEGSKERIQKFEGLVIKVSHGYGTDKTFMVRGLYSGCGVEKIFPLYSPNIKKIEVIKKAKVRRAKLYYMRNLSGKSARLHEEYLSAEQTAVNDAIEQRRVEQSAANEVSGAPSPKAEESTKPEKVATEPKAVTEKTEAKPEVDVKKPEEEKKAEPKKS